MLAGVTPPSIVAAAALTATDVNKNKNCFRKLLHLKRGPHYQSYVALLLNSRSSNS